MTKLTPDQVGRRTQWATQFLAAAELVRRDYTVSFTMGNLTPIADLMVGTRDGKQFWVDVKGLSAKADWSVKRKAQHRNLYYILVLLAPEAKPGEERKVDQFFVMTQDEANKELDNWSEKASPAAKNRNWPGFKFAQGLPFKDAWDKLPPAWRGKALGK